MEVKPEILTTAYENNEGDLVAINGNYAIQGGLNPVQDAVLLESTENNPYVNIVACQEGHENDEKITDTLHSCPHLSRCSHSLGRVRLYSVQL